MRRRILVSLLVSVCVGLILAPTMTSADQLAGWVRGERLVRLLRTRLGPCDAGRRQGNLWREHRHR
jgi:hypothetical protein